MSVLVSKYERLLSITSGTQKRPTVPPARGCRRRGVEAPGLGHGRAGCGADSLPEPIPGLTPDGQPQDDPAVARARLGEYRLDEVQGLRVGEVHGLVGSSELFRRAGWTNPYPPGPGITGLAAGAISHEIYYRDGRPR